VTNRLGARPGQSRALERILELEQERNEAQHKARILVALNIAFARITLAREPGEIVGKLLEAALDPLGFGRAVYLERRERSLVACRELDSLQTAEPEVATDALQSLPLENDPFFEPSGAVLGRTGDLCAPVIDVRGWYIFARVANDYGSFGYLYVDGHAGAEPSAWQAHLVETLAGVATLALHNGHLFTRTQELATRDSLTGLLNRRTFDERVRDEVESSKGHAKSLAIVIIDLDDLKKINDSGGHSCGDHVLRRLSASLCESCRTADVVARIAGDEFAMLLVDTNVDLARQVIRRVSASLRRNGLRCSIGVAVFPQDADTAENLMRAADSALYAVKAAGKNGFAFYSTGAPG
jgi:diguanylate cyclase (GGDEF)-like protein